MGIIENVHNILAVVILVILDLAAVAKGVSVIVKRAKSIQSTTEEEKAAAKTAVVENLQQIIFGLVTDAEKELGGGTGKLKSSKVAGWIYDKIPDELKPIFTAEEIQDMIDTVLQDAQKYWEKNGKAREYIDSGTATLLTAETGIIAPAVVAPAVTADEIVQAVGDRIGDAIVKAAEAATVGPQDGQNDAPDNSPTQGQPAATEAAEDATGGEIPQA